MGLFSRSYEKQEIPEAKHLGTELSVAGSSWFDKWTLRPYNPAELYQKRGNYDLYDEIREDDQVKAVLTLKKIMVLNSDWDIECEDEEAREFLKLCLTEYLDGLFTKRIYEVLSALDYGWSITEKVFNYCDTKYGKKIVLEKLKTRPPHTFDLYTDDFGNISKILQHTDSGDIDLDPKKFILYQHNKEYENPYGNSEINKGVYRAWWSKNAIIKFWNIYLERFGMPTHVGKMPRSAGEGEKATFMKMLKNIQAKTSFTIPNDFELELLSAAGSGASEYEKAINKYDTMIARTCLVPDLIGLSGSETAGGSYALGKEQFGVFYNTIAYLRNDIERLVNKEIVQPLLMWNYGTKYAAKFKFNIIDEERKRSDLLLWLDAVKSGKIPVMGEGINWFLDQVNAPKIDEEELKKIEEEKEKMREQLANGGAQPVGEKKPGEKEDPKEEPEEKPVAKEEKPEEPKDKKEYAKSEKRALTAYEKKVDFAKIESEFDSIADEFLPQFKEVYSLIINALVDDIRRKKIVENKRLELINKLQLKHISKSDKLFRDLLKASYGKGMGSVEKKNYNIATVIGLDDEDIAAWISENAAFINEAEAAEILKKTKGVLIDGIRSGAGTREMVQQFEKALSPWEITQIITDKNGDTMNLQSRLETIIRTNINKAYNEARSVSYENMITEIQAYQYSAIMDSRTSDICAALDGKVFKPSELAYYNPPNHYNCRSLIVPIFVDEEFSGFSSDIPATKQDGGFLTINKNTETNDNE